MYVVHILEVCGEMVNESVSIFDSAAAIKPRESFPRSYNISLLRDPFQSAVESLSIGAARALKFDKNAKLTFSSTVPGVAELIAEEWAQG